MDNLSTAQSTLIALLQLKTDFWKQLPWLLAGIAHPDMDVARQLMRLALHKFDQYPRQVVHHPITWQLLNPSSHFRRYLERFVDGESLDSMPRWFRRRVARFRFLIVVETTIEVKHSKVTAARKCHYIGPTRVSLVNRLPLLERWLLRGHVDILDILSNFTRARKLRNAVGLGVFR